MIVTIKKSKASGTVAAPPSKSMAHRALICGALSNESKINNIEYSNDISATLECLVSLGAKVQKCGNTVSIGGLNPDISNNTTLDCGESGSTLRFMLPIAAAIANDAYITGSGRLPERPLSPLMEEMEQKGIRFLSMRSDITVSEVLESIPEFEESLAFAFACQDQFNKMLDNQIEWFGVISGSSTGVTFEYYDNDAELAKEKAERNGWDYE